MPICCVSGCKSRQSSTSKLKFYRIPSEYRPFQADRRRLWLKAIREANGAAELGRNARVCGAHFKSGEASMDHTNPDFVPSVFQCIDPNQRTKTNVKGTCGRRKKGHCKAKANNIKETTSPPDGRVSETQTQSSSSLLQEEETATDGDETEIQLQTSTPNKASEMTQDPKGLSNLPAMVPILCLKSVFAPRAGYLCELCSQKFSCASELLKHKQLHENPVSCEVRDKVSTELPTRAPGPSFPCNICDRSFPTSRSLKRHKLLHVKDERRCPKCGIIFCQLHNHVSFLPLPKDERDSTTGEALMQDAAFNTEFSREELETSAPLTVGSEVKENSLTGASLLDEPGHDAGASGSVVAMKPEPARETLNPLPPPSHRNVPNQIPVPRLKRLLHPHVSRCFGGDDPADYIQVHLPQSPQLRPHLKIFSPQRLTSALLEVKRNYEYILNEPPKVKCREQRTAFDLEVVL